MVAAVVVVIAVVVVAIHDVFNDVDNIFDQVDGGGTEGKEINFNLDLIVVLFFISDTL